MYSIKSQIFNHPACIIVAGPSKSGKSTLIFNILRNNQLLFDPKPTRIVYYYSVLNSDFNKYNEIYPRVEFIEGLPQSSDDFNERENNVIIIDDQMDRANDSLLGDIFTKYSHHKNISVFFLTQNIFSNVKGFRTISLNSDYLIAMNMPRDRGQIAALGRQMFPKHPKFLNECYEDETSKPFGHLLIDLTQKTPNELRVQSNILDERIIYKPK